MMRKLSVLVLLTVYSATAIGVPLHYHYCEGELQHVTFIFRKGCDSHDEDAHVEESPFACCLGKEVSHCEESAASESDCCDNESDLLQIGDEFVAVTNTLADDYTALMPVVEVVEMAGEYVQSLLANPANGPPLPAQKKYLTNCSFVFYG